MTTFSIRVTIDGIVSLVDIQAADVNSARNTVFFRMTRDNPGHTIRVLR